MVKQKQSCDRCGKILHPETWIYSRHTSSHYCRDLDGCTKRAKRKSRAGEAA